MKLCVLYIPGLDPRRLGQGWTPFLDALITAHGMVRLATLPMTEHLPTLLTGRLPHEHGLWGPVLRYEDPPSTPAQRLADRLPDLVTTTWQLAHHHLNGPLDGATLPPRQRRQFDWQRFKYMKKSYGDLCRQPLGGCPSLLSLPATEGAYIYHDDIDKLGDLARHVDSQTGRLLWIEAHALDRHQHWWLDSTQRTGEAYQRIDRFIAEAHAIATATATGLLILSDHGMEPVRGVIAIEDHLRGLIDKTAIASFIETSKASFWCRDRALADRLEAALSGIPNTVLLGREDLKADYAIAFEDRRFGDFFLYAEPGFTFYPNAFSHLLAGRVLALLDHQQRPRLRHSIHRGEHGYLPHAACESGLAVAAIEGVVVARADARLVDIAPSLARILAVDVPAGMSGKNDLWQPAGG